jgi:hypothetical protein
VAFSQPASVGVSPHLGEGRSEADWLNGRHPQRSATSAAVCRSKVLCAAEDFEYVLNALGGRNGVSAFQAYFWCVPYFFVRSCHFVRLAHAGVIANEKVKSCP